MIKKIDILSLFKKHAKGKTAVFIDAANILYSQQSLGWEIDYKKLYQFFKKNCQLTIMNFYYANISKNEGQKRFFQMLKDTGFFIRTKPVKYIKTPKGVIKKGNLDVELTFDTITQINKFKTYILLSGDSDFEIILNYLKNKNKKVIVISTKGHISIELIKNCHKYFDMKKFKEYWKRRKRIRR
ncbi:MAG: NYN domain-containing protein [Patescibacteria group bacterium]|nr:NYN domain-containing protein [Patescibacteria group bacterium]